MTTRLLVAGNGRGVELRSDDDAAVRRRMGNLAPPVRARRIDGRLVIDFDAAGRLLDYDPAGFQADADVLRAIANRARVRRSVQEVRSEERRRAAAPVAEVRRLVAESDLADRLDDHQARSVAIMTVPEGWGLPVFDEQGTGKTVTTIAAFDLLVERGEAEVLVVVAPKSMINEWAAEFRRFVGNRYRVDVLDGGARRRPLTGADVVVLNYEAVASRGQQLRLLARRANTVLAVDESFLVKNPSTIRTQAVAALREWCTRCFVLCGTPAPNSPHDLVAQFDLVDFGFTFDGVRLDDDRDVAAAQVRTVLNHGASFVRNLKSVVLPNLPTRTFNEVSVPLAPIQRAAYEQALDHLIIDLTNTSDQDFRRTIDSYLERRQALLRICSDPSPVVPGYSELPAKVAALDDLLDEMVSARGEKVVLWSFYRSSLDRLAERYARFGLVRIDGSVSSADRRRAVAAFQHEDSTSIFLGNPAAAGAGLTLHRARLAVYESFSNQAAHFLQSLDRIHRRGQEREVEYYSLLCEATIEEDEYALLLSKADRQADLLGDGASARPTRHVMLDELVQARNRLRARL